MTAAALGKRISSLWRGIGVVSVGVMLGLAPWIQASAAPAKKAAKPAETRKAAPAPAKAAPKATKAAPTKVAGKSAPAAKAAKRDEKPDRAASAATRIATKGKAEAKKTAARKAETKTAARDAKARGVAKDSRAGRETRHVANTRDSRNERVKTSLVAGTRAQARSERVAARETRLSLREVTPVAHVERPAPAPRLSIGQMTGLRSAGDALDLKSSVALVMDQDSNEVLFSKNDHAILPIASITKLMTGLIVSDARLPLDEMLTITEEDVDYEKGSRSRLVVGTTLTRGELMHLALMSSENRAAHALGRTFPGGMQRFVGLMNARAIMLGMKETRYVEPTGLSSANRSSAHDLATLVNAASADPLLRQLTTSLGYEVAVGNRVLQFSNTNRLVHDPDWQIGLQKTGYISEAGRCLVMQARVAGRKLIMVFLDSTGKNTRLADAERVRRWLEVERSSNTVAGNGYAG